LCPRVWIGKNSFVNQFVYSLSQFFKLDPFSSS
jgi:hypothetical protein